MNTEYVIEKINAALAQKTELHKASHAFADHHDEVTTGLVALAAPDLLAALEDFTEAVWSDCRLPLEMRNDLAAIYHNTARAAIAKARA